MKGDKGMKEISTLLSDYELVDETLVSTIKAILDRRSKGPCRLPDVQANEDYDGVHFSKKRSDILVLLVAIKFYPEYFQGFGPYIVIEIEEYLEKNLLFPELLALARISGGSKISFLRLLFNYTKYDFQRLENLLKDNITLERTIDCLKFKYVHYHKPRRPERRKGYKDHGTLRPKDHWIETHDISFTEIQNRKEQEREDYQNLVSAILRENGDWYLKLLSLRKED
jgi:hypothetical protein